MQGNIMQCGVILVSRMNDPYTLNLTLLPSLKFTFGCWDRLRGVYAHGRGRGGWLGYTYPCSILPWFFYHQLVDNRNIAHPKGKSVGSQLSHILVLFFWWGTASRINERVIMEYWRKSPWYLDVYVMPLKIELFFDAKRRKQTAACLIICRDTGILPCIVGHTLTARIGFTQWSVRASLKYQIQYVSWLDFIALFELHF